MLILLTAAPPLCYPLDGKTRRNTPTTPLEVTDMQNILREYDAKPDAKGRLTLRGSRFDSYHVREMADSSILLEPREPSVPFRVSANTLAMMDAAVSRLEEGRVSPAPDLSDFED